MHNLTFSGREQLNATIWRYNFQIEKPLEFAAGQYARFRFPFEIDDPNGKQHRTFTIISQPNETTVSFMTRVTEPHSLFKQYLVKLLPGDRMSVDDPRGDVVLPADPDIPLVFACAGIGIASTISILTGVNQRREQRRISLLYGVKTPEDRVFSDLIDTFPFIEHQILVEPSQIRATDIFDYAHNDPRTQFCISGPPGYIESVKSGLLALGANEANIRFDAYKNYGY
jgi:benzoate/toluate 1,2-dioxygenase reductase subunit